MKSKHEEEEKWDERKGTRTPNKKTMNKKRSKRSKYSSSLYTWRESIHALPHKLATTTMPYMYIHYEVRDRSQFLHTNVMKKFRLTILI